jgi:hypothetical protein
MVLVNQIKNDLASSVVSGSNPVVAHMMANGGLHGHLLQDLWN